MIITGCSNEKPKTVVIEDDNEIRVEQYLPSVSKVYEINAFDYDSSFDKRPLGWLDDKHVINDVDYLPQISAQIKAERVEDILNIQHFGREFNHYFYGGGSFYDLEKYNYLTGESERVISFKASTDYSSLETTNGCKKIIITECNA